MCLALFSRKSHGILFPFPYSLCLVLSFFVFSPPQSLIGLPSCSRPSRDLVPFLLSSPSCRIPLSFSLHLCCLQLPAGVPPRFVSSIFFLAPLPGSFFFGSSSEHFRNPCVFSSLASICKLKSVSSLFSVPCFERSLPARCLVSRSSSLSPVFVHRRRVVWLRRLPFR